MKPPLTIARRELQGVEGGVLIQAMGALRGAGSLALRDQLEHELAAGSRAVLLDLSRVDTAESATLGHLLDVHERLRSAGGVLILAGLTDPVRLVFDSIGLLGFFSLADSVGEAEAALRLGSDFGRSSGSGSDLGRAPLS